MRPVALVPLLLLLAAPASAQLSFTGQDRSLHSSSQSISDLWEVGTNPVFPDFDPPSLTQTQTSNDDVVSPGSGPFEATATTTDPSIFAVPATGGSAAASQASLLGAGSIRALGDVTASPGALLMSASTLSNLSIFLGASYDFGVARSLESGSSSFEASFDVATSATYPFHAHLVVSPPGGVLFGDTAAMVTVELREAGGAVLAQASAEQDLFGICIPASCEASIDVEVALAPGSYVLSAQASGSAQGQCVDIGGGLNCFTPQTTASFDVALGGTTVPALGGSARLVLGLVLALVSLPWARRIRARR